jgi:hypothetical protein
MGMTTAIVTRRPVATPPMREKSLEANSRLCILITLDLPFPDFPGDEEGDKRSQNKTDDGVFPVDFIHRFLRERNNSQVS